MEFATHRREQGPQGRGRNRYARRPQAAYIADEAQSLLWSSEDGNRFYLLSHERPCVVVLPSVSVRRFVDLRPVDLHSFWGDIYKFTYVNHVNSHQIIVHENDWRISPHVHAKISITPNDAQRMQAWLDSLYGDNTTTKPDDDAPPPPPPATEPATEASTTDIAV